MQKKPTLNCLALKLNYFEKIYFPHPLICQSNFNNEKVENRRN